MIRNYYIILILLLTVSSVCLEENTIGTKEHDSLSVEQADSLILVTDSTLEDVGAITAEQVGEKAQLKQVFSLLWPLVLHYRWYIVAVIVLIIVLYIVDKNRKRQRALRPTFTSPPAQATPESQPDIVVRRKTTTILKKQNLGDVLHNENYLRIDCDEFCSNSSVRRMYIKNTCIKDIYNMYSDDLRNPENPKEDGCMVLGRWVYDDETDEYYVSLEQVVLPGDDAVFKEYELNFGGKIKLRVAEKLRKLRRDTDLQYDMTCWVHSHPGLGVFFSNSDNGVHMQLKHAIHPRFLTAIVVDILTPKMDMGIFTFKHDHELVVNSRQDITRLYSLEKLYQWALESDRLTFKQDDYYNVLSTAQDLDELCNGIQLSNGSIIDICKLIEVHNSDLIAYAHGYPHTHGIYTEFVVEDVSKNLEVADRDTLGCLIAGAHLSLPSIQKAIDGLEVTCKFVLFYSIANELLVSMPVLNGKLLMDEKYYSKEKIEDLKIWTRRKR